MKIHAQCKVCAKELWLTVDDAYAQERDPYKLIGMATCNPCYDRRVRKRNLESAIERICRKLGDCSHKELQETIAQWQSPLEQWLEKYTALICAIHGKRQVVCDASVVASILERPRQWAEILQQWVNYILQQVGPPLPGHAQPTP